MNEYTYKIKDTGVTETVDTAEQLKIVKSGISAEFTLKEVKEHMKYLDRVSKELQGKRLVEDAKATNVLMYNSFIKDLTEEQLHAAHMYFTSMAFCKDAEDKVKEIEDQIEAYTAEVAEIYKQTGITPNNEENTTEDTTEEGK